MAEVKMDLNELKALETKLEQLEVEKQQLINDQKMIIVMHKYYNGKIVPGKNPQGGVTITGVRLKRQEYNDRANQRGGSPSSWNPWRTNEDPYLSGLGNYPTERFSDSLTIRGAIELGYIDVNLKEDSSRVSKEFINLDEAKDQLRAVLDEQYSNMLNLANQRASKAEYELVNVNDINVKKFIKLDEEHREQLDNLLKGNESVLKITIAEWTDRCDILQKKYDELEQNYQDLKEDKERVSLEKQNNKLKDELYLLQHRGFWARLFNTK